MESVFMFVVAMLSVGLPSVVAPKILLKNGAN
jgi:hypothetical protein